MGSVRGITSALNPAPVMISAVSRAKTSELWRASKPITTDPPLWPVSRRYAARPGRRARDHDPVHPVGPGAERAAQAGGAELEGAGEAVGEVGLLAPLGGGDEGLELGAGLLVGVLGCPGAGRLEQGGLVGRHGHGRTLSPRGVTASVGGATIGA